MNFKCIFKHKEGKKEVSYIDEYGKHYMTKCLRCGEAIYYANEVEEEINKLTPPQSEEK